jgi:MFS family permease
MRIHHWRNIFFFEGLITVIVGLLAPILMPTVPSETWFLNARERRIAHDRLITKSGLENEKIQVHHVTRSLANINNYICAFGFFFINITVQGISLFMVRVSKQYRRNGTSLTQFQAYHS